MSHTRRRQLMSRVIAAGSVWLLVTLAVYVFFGGGEAWRGELRQVRGHNGEIHLLIQLDSQPSSSPTRFVEAFTRDHGFAREISDYATTAEARAIEAGDAGGDGNKEPLEGDRVVVEGKRLAPDAAGFRLRSGVPLVELTAGQRGDDRRSRAGVGKRRVWRKTGPGRKRSALANMIRTHPLPSHTVVFRARYGGYVEQGVQLFPSQADRRPVLVEFPGKSGRDFLRYRVDDPVYVDAVLSPNASPSDLVLRGKSIRRLAEPHSPVTAEARGTRP